MYMIRRNNYTIILAGKDLIKIKQNLENSVFLVFGKLYKTHEKITE